MELPRLSPLKGCCAISYIGACASSQDVREADSDASGLHTASPSEGLCSRHSGTYPSPLLSSAGSINVSDDCRPDGAAGGWTSSAPPQGSTILSGLLRGQDGAAVGQARIDPASSGLNDYATSGEQADLSVRCTGLGANRDLSSVAEQRHGPVSFAGSKADVHCKADV